jgi:hypothetical protein
MYRILKLYSCSNSLDCSSLDLPSSVLHSSRFIECFLNHLVLLHVFCFFVMWFSLTFYCSFPCGCYHTWWWPTAAETCRARVRINKILSRISDCIYCVWSIFERHVTFSPITRCIPKSRETIPCPRILFRIMSVFSFIIFLIKKQNEIYVIKFTPPPILI